MIKRWGIGLLALLMVLCGGTALADDTLSGELARITQSVKTTLAIDDSYTDFHGEQVERGYGVTWYLNWSSAENSLNVEADKDGRIISYNRYNYSDRYYSSGFAPIFPQNKREQAQQSAENFARRVLAKGESIVFQKEQAAIIQPREQNSFYFSGSISLNGIPSPLYISVSVDAEDMSVTSFWRDTLDSGYVGGIPSGTAKIGADAAKAKLAAQQKFTLAYYRTNNTKEARLQYHPVQDNTYYVDAQSGELLDMNKLYEEARDKAIDRGISGGGEGMRNTSADMAVADEAVAAPQAAKLSPTEQAGVEKLEGLLTREQLDAKVRAISEFGVGKDYTLSNVSYRQDYNGSDSYYAAHLEYYRLSDARSLGISTEDFKSLQDEGKKLYTYKYATLNAASGELQYLSTSLPYVNELLIKAEKQDYEKETAAFLQRYCGDKFAKTALQQTEPGVSYAIDNSGYFHYVQQVNGYDFEENSLTVSANPFTGEIETFYRSGWQEDITFAPVTGIITEDKASGIYQNSLECSLVYRGLPQAIDPGSPQMKPLIDYGYNMVHSLALVYSMEAEYPDNVYAIDALSGETLTYAQQENGAISYDDIEGQPAQAQIEKLGSYGIGFTGGSFQPTIQLTELDMLLFLLSAEGRHYTPEELSGDKTDEIYRQAYNLGILTRGQKQADKQISRSEFVKTIISMSGYGKTAALPGIYVCDFADAAQIPAELYGYVAIAQGLGLVQGGSDKQFAATEIISRAEAAVIFYNFLDRKY